MGAGRGERESMIVGETSVADFEGWLGAGEGDAPLLIDADAPERRLASGLTTEYFALQGWHGLKFGDADGGVHHLELAQRILLQFQRHTFDGPALKNRFGVFVREVNNHGGKIPNNGMPARHIILFLRMFVGDEWGWTGFTGWFDSQDCWWGGVVGEGVWIGGEVCVGRPCWEEGF